MSYWPYTKGSMLLRVLVTSVCVTVVLWTPWGPWVTGWQVTYRRKHAALCISDLSLHNVLQWIYWHHAAHVLLAGTQREACCTVTSVCVAVASSTPCSPCVAGWHTERSMLHCALVTSVWVAVASSTSCSPCVAGWHTGWRGVDVAGPQVEPDEDVPSPQSPVIVWKDPDIALVNALHSGPVCTLSLTRTQAPAWVHALMGNTYSPVGAALT